MKRKESSLSELDRIIIKEFSKGKKYEEISKFLKLKGIYPNSLRTVEERIRLLKKTYRAKTLFHLAIILKSNNII